MSLNKAQEQAIAHQKGPCMVLAGPGSGKTFTMIRRIEYLIKRHKVKPSEILVVTFTKMAAKEMQQRFADKMGKKGVGVTFGTFHSIFYGILRWAYGFGENSILTEVEKYQILKGIIEKENIEIGEEQEFVREIIGAISTIKNNRIDIDSYECIHCPKEIFRNICDEYEKERQKIRKVDFDDMLVQTYKLFAQKPEVLKAWQEKFRYILIDEFQDINEIQFEIIKMLAMPENNLFVVGDDDQSIYGFRGSRPDIMLEFTMYFPDTSMIYLTNNYRCTKAIVNASKKVIGNNTKRYQKEVQTSNEQGRAVHIQELRDSVEESRYVAAKVKEAKDNGALLRKIAVLYRSSHDARALVETFTQENLPFHMKENIFNIDEHFVGKDIRAYLQMALGNRSRKNFLQIINHPNRYISRNAIEMKEVSFEDIRAYYAEQEWMQDRIDRLELDLKILKNMAPNGAIQYIRKSIGYDEFLKEKSEDLLEILSEIEEQAKKYHSIEEWLTYIDEYSKRLLLQKSKEQPKDAVSFMTMHSAKGLEFDTVFIVGANEKIIPYKKAETRENVEEERRLFYVAMTRAKRKLCICYTKERNGKDMEPSRFVVEILQGTKWAKK